MKRTFMLLAAGLALALTLGAAPAFAKPDCGENTGQKATGKPIPIGGVTSMSGIGSFKEAGDAVVLEPAEARAAVRAARLPRTGAAHCR